MPSEESIQSGTPYSPIFGGAYVPSQNEKYIIDHLEQLGYDSLDNPPGCTIWTDRDLDINKNLSSYAKNLDRFVEAVQNFTPVNLDVLDSIKKNSTHDVCSRLKLPISNGGLQSVFQSGQLSVTKSGFIEPLLPPLRSHKICWDRKYLMSLDYLIHDFEAMCYKLKATSRRVLIDMGASLSFHGNNQPIIQLMNLYEKFGFHFDHIYGFEVTFTEPSKVYKSLLPEKYFAAYHWINTGVSHVMGNKMNPLNSILQKFDEDDFIVVKLDIDTASIELPLAQQLVDGGPGKIYHRLIDQFYFEHHVHLGELQGNWGRSMDGTVNDSLKMFYSLRQNGIPVHYWP